MTRQTTAPIVNQQFTTTDRVARELARFAEDPDAGMVLDAPYQRGDVWTTDQRISLVRSWLMGLPIPAVIVNNRMTRAWKDANPGEAATAAGYAAIDGRQRITTAVLWFSGELLVPASWFAAEDIERVTDTDDGPYVRYPDLCKPARTGIAFSWKLPMAEAQVATVAEEAEIYLLVNGGGTPQSDADMARAAQIAATEDPR